MLIDKTFFQRVSGLLMVFTTLFSCHNSNSNGQIIKSNVNDTQPMNNEDLKSGAAQNQNGLFPEPDKAPYFYVSLGNEWVKINDNWSIRLAEALSDNRCPSGAGSCEVAGSAEVKVQFQQPDVDYYRAYFETLEVSGLNRFPMPDGAIKPPLLKSIIINRKDAITEKQIGFKITLVDLRPYPFKEFVRDIKKINYTGLFLIEELK